MGEITVTRLLTTPVKGTRISSVDAIELSQNGARGDRAFYIVDDRGRLANGKVVRNLQVVVSEYEPDTDELALAFPDGTRVTGRVTYGERVQTQFHGRPRSDREVLGPWADAISSFFDRPLRLIASRTAVDRGIDAVASIISTGSVRRLAEVGDRDAVDARRFRMLIEVDGIEPHAEDAWVGQRVRVGEAVVSIGGHVGRCLITSRDPDTAEIDLPTLDLLAGYRGECESTEPLPFGVYGKVLAGGPVRIGDRVSVQP